MASVAVLSSCLVVPKWELSMRRSGSRRDDSNSNEEERRQRAWNLHDYIIDMFESMEREGTLGSRKGWGGKREGRVVSTSLPTRSRLLPSLYTGEKSVDTRE